MLALSNQGKQDRRGDEDRAVRARDYADEQREGESVYRVAAADV